MISENQVVVKKIFLVKILDYISLLKLRLSSLVILSSVLGFFIAAKGLNYSWGTLFSLTIGGLFVTGASNGLNQVWETALDAKMERTKNRPLPKGGLKKIEAILICSFLATIGLLLLWFYAHPLAAILSLLALFSYVFVYTPLKQITPFAVFVGAFPGAVPPMIGYVAFTGTFNLEAGLLFATQFIWQFPHFWAIAWVLDGDYKRGGFNLLPSRSRKDKTSAFLIFLYSLFLIPVSLLPAYFNYTGSIYLFVSILIGALFSIVAFRFFIEPIDKLAKRLMFASFIYLPVIQIVYLIDKI